MPVLARATSVCTLCPTRSVCIAADLDGAALSHLDDCLSTSDPLGKGDILYRTGDRSEHCYLVRSGAFKTTETTGAGEEYVTGFAFPGELLGLSGLRAAHFEETAIALGSGTVCRIRLQELPRLWSLGAGQALLRLIGEHERLRINLQVNLCQSRAPARIAGFLSLAKLRFARLGFDPNHLPLSMSRTDLANHLGLTLECLSRVLNTWRRTGVIDTDRDLIRILKPDELACSAPHLGGV
ncbi:MAG: helix-turn-helix domain-containing protein [Pseudomonadales bacterium]